jgi:hypothetical protein
MVTTMDIVENSVHIRLDDPCSEKGCPGKYDGQARNPGRIPINP